MEIFIIDEQPVYSKGLSSILKKEFPDYNVTTSCSIKDGLLTLKSLGVNYNLLILGVNGEDKETKLHLEELFIINSNLIVIILESATDCHSFMSYLKMGAQGVIPKTYSIDRMVEAILECCNGTVYIPPYVRDAIKKYESKNIVCNNVASSLHLTKRQLQVLSLIERRMTNNEIADKLSVSLATVKTHINKLYSALDVCGRKDCIKRSYDLGILYDNRDYII